jgi:hypothetical protein
MTSMDIVTDALRRLDSRRHVMASRLEVSYEGGRWVAQVLADPLPRSCAATGSTPSEAIANLSVVISRLDWRTVRR